MLPLPTRLRISKLVLLLSSDQPGEVVNAAAAIGRTLKAEKATWHDLAALIDVNAKPQEKPKEQPKSRRRAAPDGDIDFDEAADCARNDWERDFVDSVREQYEERGTMTERQEAVLRRILERGCGW